MLHIEKINKIYHAGKMDFQALYDITLDFQQGEFSAIAGPSGSGKTTLLNIIGCIDVPESGEILLDGMPLSGKSSMELAYLRREYFGFVFQTYNLMPVLTVYENVELPLKLLARHTAEEMRERTMGILKTVGLAGLERRKPAELSGGQQQRVSIARSLVKHPRLVLADEPTANLDSVTGEAIIDLMKEMNEREKVTFLFSTHDKHIMHHARRIIRMHDGRIVDAQ